jgi:hypothetical protein
MSRTEERRPVNEVADAMEIDERVTNSMSLFFPDLLPFFQQTLSIEAIREDLNCFETIAEKGHSLFRNSKEAKHQGISSLREYQEAVSGYFMQMFVNNRLPSIHTMMELLRTIGGGFNPVLSSVESISQSPSPTRRFTTFIDHSPRRSTSRLPLGSGRNENQARIPLNCTPLDMLMFLVGRADSSYPRVLHGLLDFRRKFLAILTPSDREQLSMRILFNMNRSPENLLVEAIQVSDEELQGICDYLEIYSPEKVRLFMRSHGFFRIPDHVKSTIDPVQAVKLSATPDKSGSIVSSVRNSPVLKPEQNVSESAPFLVLPPGPPPAHRRAPSTLPAEIPSEPAPPKGGICVIPPSLNNTELLSQLKAKISKMELGETVAEKIENSLKSRNPSPSHRKQYVSAQSIEKSGKLHGGIFEGVLAPPSPNVTSVSPSKTIRPAMSIIFDQVTKDQSLARSTRQKSTELVRLVENALIWRGIDPKDAAKLAEKYLISQSNKSKISQLIEDRLSAQHFRQSELESLACKLGGLETLISLAGDQSSSLSKRQTELLGIISEIKKIVSPMTSDNVEIIKTVLANTR